MTTIVCVVVRRRDPTPLAAVTATMYSLLSASLAGLLLRTSSGFSKSGGAAKDSPPASVISKRSPSAPPSVKLVMLSSGSPSVATTGPTAASCSFSVNAGSLVMLGLVFVSATVSATVTARLAVRPA